MDPLLRSPTRTILLLLLLQDNARKNRTIHHDAKAAYYRHSVRAASYVYRGMIKALGFGRPSLLFVDLSAPRSTHLLGASHTWQQSVPIVWDVGHTRARVVVCASMHDDTTSMASSMVDIYHTIH